MNSQPAQARRQGSQCHRCGDIHIALHLKRLQSHAQRLRLGVRLRGLEAEQGPMSHIEMDDPQAWQAPPKLH